VGSVIKLFLNGVEVHSFIANANAGSWTTSIGGLTNDTEKFLGYIDSIRVTKGVPRYFNLNFVPPTEEMSSSNDSYFGNVSLLLNMNGTNGSTSFIDSSNNNLTITTNGNAQISNAVTLPNRNQAAYFDGNGDFLSLADNAVFNLSGIPFTIEAWIYPTAISSTDQTIFSKDQYGVNLSWLLLFNNARFKFMTSNANTVWDVPASVQVNTWQHVALAYNGSILTLFLNGIALASTTITVTNASSSIAVGCASPNSPNAFFQGYIDDLRITRGYSRYGLTFIPPAAEFPNNSSDQYWNNVELLLNMNSNFSDSSSSPKTVTTGGSPQISTSIKKYGAGSANFSSGYVNIPTTTALGFGSADFTIEMWVFKSSSITDWNTVFEIGTGSNAYQNGLMIRLQATNNDPLYIAGTNYGWNPAANFPLNQWNHLALVRVGNKFDIYINGNSVFSTINTANLGSSAAGFFGASIHSGGGQLLGGYIDDVRITKGVARYSGNFAVPQSRFENDSANVSLLINSSISDSAVNFLKDSSLALTEFTIVGSPQATNAQTRNGNNTLFFNGSTSLSTTNNNLILGSDDYVLEAWIYPTTNTVACIFNQGNSDATGAFCFYRGSNQKLGFYANAGTRMSESSGITNVPQNQWTHVALVKNQYRYSIFINGVLDQTIDGTVYSHTQAVFKIGNGYGGIGFFNGYMDDIKVTRGTTPIINLLGLPLPQKEAAKSPEPKILKGIPTNGLILYLGEESYKNFGTQWQDLSENGYNHYLTSTNFRNSSNVTAVNLTSNERRLRPDANNTFTYGPNYTVIVWAKLLPDGKVGDWRTLLRSSPNDHGIIVQNNSNIVGYYDNNTNSFNSYGLNLGTLGLENCWAMYTLVGQNGATSKLFINDGSITGNTLNFNLVGNAHLELGNHAGVQPFGDVGHFMVYDRAFSQEEIAQIFNTLRLRFGAPSNNDGLVLHLDASNPKSYSGGTIWKDLSETMGDINVQNRSNNWTFRNDPDTGLMCLYNESNSVYYGAGINIPLKGFNKIEGALEMWLKPTDLSDGGAHGWFVNADGANFTNTENWFWVGMWDNGNTFYLRQGRTPNTCCDQDFAIGSLRKTHYPLNKWVHMCVTWDIGNARAYLYKNGVQIGSKINLSTANIQDIFPSEIGQMFNSHGRSDNAQFKGYCNIYKIYNRELSAAQVLSNYNATSSRFAFTNNVVFTVDASNPASYPGTTVANQWYDLSGNGGEFALTNTPIFTSQDGGNIIFDGTNDYVNLDYNPFTSSMPNFSISVWFYKTKDGTLLSNHLGSVSWESVWARTNEFVVNPANNSTNRKQLLFSTPLNQWNNLVFIHSLAGNVMRVFLNGVEIATLNDSATPWNTTVFPSIGATKTNTGTTDQLGGRIASVTVYNKVLTSSEILANYNKELPKIQEQESINRTNLELYLNLNHKSSPWNINLWNDLSGKGRNVTLLNTMGFGTDAAYEGTPVQKVKSVGARYAYFNGTSNYGTLSNVDYNQLTLLMWVRRARTTTSTTVDRLFMSVNTGGWGFYFVNNFLTLGKVGTGSTSSASQILDTNWKLLAVSHTGTETKFYINGVLDVTRSYSATFASSSGNYSIGSRSAGEYFQGSISSAALYSRVLTDAEILTYFNNTKSIFGIS
jgi:hypothetical protein